MKPSTLLKNKLLQNIFSQGFVQLANYAVPLLVIPYVTRVLGPELFGTASFAQNMASYATLLVNFGFDFSATQEVSINRNNPEKLQQTFWEVVAFKLMLLVISFIALFLLSDQQHNATLVFAAALLNVGCVVFPSWFLQGVEQIAKMSLFTFFVRVLGAVVVFAFVKSPDHVLLYLLALSLSNVVVGFVAFFYVIRKYNIGYSVPKSLLSSPSVRKGFPIFLNTFLVNCNVFVGVSFVGSLMSDYDVGIYSGAQKIMTAILMVVSQPFLIALFPRMSKKFADDRQEGFLFMRRCLVLITFISGLASILVYFLSPMAVGLMLGEKFARSVSLLCVLAPLPLLYTVASTLTVQGLFGMQLQRYAPLVGVLVFLSNMFFCWLLIPKFGVEGAAFSWMLCQLVEIMTASLIIETNRRKK
ncbi:MAG: flippase [Paludibacteraceae bacterium]|nr:flippase [Paludibacteraceae bacterium]